MNRLSVAKRVRVGNLDIDPVTTEAALARILYYARRPASSTAVVVTPNIQHVVQAEDDADFAHACNSADLVLPDGWPVVAVMRRVGDWQGGRVAGSDLAPRVLAAACEAGLSVAFVGGRDSTATTAAANARVLYPGLDVVLARSPEFATRPTAADADRLTRDVAEVKADILFLCLGAPKSELLAAATARQLNVAVVLCFGAVIDHLAGTQIRAPRWVQSVGLEWAFRIAKEPRRLFGRYARAAPVFAVIAAKAVTGERDR